MFFEEDQFHYNNDQRKKKHKNGNAVNAMHIPDPFAAWRIGVTFLDVKVFCQLS